MLRLLWKMAIKRVSSSSEIAYSQNTNCVIYRLDTLLVTQPKRCVKCQSAETYL